MVIIANRCPRLYTRPSPLASGRSFSFCLPQPTLQAGTASQPAPTILCPLVLRYYIVNNFKTEYKLWYKQISGHQHRSPKSVESTTITIGDMVGLFGFRVLSSGVVFRPFFPINKTCARYINQNGCIFMLINWQDKQRARAGDRVGGSREGWCGRQTVTNGVYIIVQKPWLVAVASKQYGI